MTVPRDCCPLMDLDEHLKNLILEELDFDDVMSIASTCKHWWNLCNDLSPDKRKVLQMSVVTLDDETFREDYSLNGEIKSRTWNRSAWNIACSQLYVSRLVIQNKVSLKSLKFLEKWAKVERLELFLPLQCPKSCLESLQKLSRDVVFFKSSEIVQNAKFGVYGFVDLLSIVSIKVQYDVDEKTINTILKQWSEGQRSLEGGFYATRKGKMDKLHVLQEDLEDFVHDVECSEMAVFFDIVVPLVGRLSVSYTTMSFSVEAVAQEGIVEDTRETKEQVSDKDYSHLLDLPKRVELAILKELQLRDVINLALTCRNWLETASSAPKFVKPTVSFGYLVVDEDGFTLSDSPRYAEFGKRFYLGTKFMFVNKIKCKAVTLKGWEFGHDDVYTPWTAYQYLVDISDNFELSSMVLNFPIFIEQDHQLMTDVCSLVSSISFNYPQVLKDSLFAFPRGMFRIYEACFVLFQNFLTHSHIINNVPIDLNVVNTVLEQYTRGQRPNLDLFVSPFIPIDGNPLKYALRGLEHYVKKQRTGVGGYTADLVVPGLDVLNMATIRQQITFRRVKQ